MAEHPDAYLQEIGDAFGCPDTAVLKAFKRLGITRKKDKAIPRAKPGTNQRVSEIADHCKERIANIDKTGIANYLYREQG